MDEIRAPASPTIDARAREANGSPQQRAGRRFVGLILYGVASMALVVAPLLVLVGSWLARDPHTSRTAAIAVFVVAGMTALGGVAAFDVGRRLRRGAGSQVTR